MPEPTDQPEPSDPREPLQSEFASDPEMMECVNVFIRQLDDRIRALEATFAEQEFDRLRSIAGEIRGAGSGYGFPSLCDAAARLECSIRDRVDVRMIRLDLEKLLSLCRRARPAA